MQLDIILTSLQDHSHVASLLGFASTTEPGHPLHRSLSLHTDTQLAEILMKTLLRNLGFHTVSFGGSIIIHLHVFPRSLDIAFVSTWIFAGTVF